MTDKEWVRDSRKNLELRLITKRYAKNTDHGVMVHKRLFLGTLLDRQRLE